MTRSLKKSAKLSLRRVRINSTSIRYKPDSSSIERDQRIEFLGGNGNDAGSGGEENRDEQSESEDKEEEHQEQDDGNSLDSEDGETSKETVEEEEEEEEEEKEGGNRVMVVVDKALDSTGAIEWAITHTLQSQDTLLLLYFTKPSGKGCFRISGLDQKKNRKLEVKTDELVHNLKKLCQTKRPGIEVEIRRLEGEDKEKGAKIVEEAKNQQVSLLVVGQEKKPPVWRLFKRWVMWKRRSGHGGLLKFCIDNASCMTIAVKPKNRKLGGYLITTKRHKNFWLLA